MGLERDNQTVETDSFIPTRWRSSVMFSGRDFGVEVCERTTGLHALTLWKMREGLAAQHPELPTVECTYRIDRVRETMEEAVSAALDVGELHAIGILRFAAEYSARVVIHVELEQFEGSVPLSLPSELVARMAALGCSLAVSVPLAWSYPGAEE